MSYINKMKKRGSFYDIHDRRIPTASAGDKGKAILVGDNGFEFGTVSGGGDKPVLYMDVWEEDGSWFGNIYNDSTIDFEALEAERNENSRIVPFSFIASIWDITESMSGDVSDDKPLFNDAVMVMDYVEENDTDEYFVEILSADGKTLLSFSISKANSDNPDSENISWYVENFEIQENESEQQFGLYMHFVYLGTGNYQQIHDQTYTLVVVDSDPRDIVDATRLINAIAGGAYLPNPPLGNWDPYLTRTGTCVKATLYWNYPGDTVLELMGSYARECAVFCGFDKNAQMVTKQVYAYDASEGLIRVGSSDYYINGNQQANDCLEELKEEYGGTVTIPLNAFKNYPYDDD